MSAPAAALWRLDARGPEDAAWRTLDTWAPRRDWHAAAAEALASPVVLPDDGTCLRVVTPRGVTGPVHVVADGVVRPLVLRDDARGYLGAEACASHDADPIAWWQTQADGRHLLRVAGAAVRVLGSPLHRHVVRAACACARDALPIWDARYPRDTRPRVAIETAERWCDGEATLAEVRGARKAAAAAAAEVAAAAAWSAAEAVWSAAEAAAAWSARAVGSGSAAAAAGTASHVRSAGHARRLVPLREVLVGLVAPAGGPR